ncbi:hypothetical protein BMF94_1236 [Rhodotorula taiwanensis]|uniref:Uncharacterized protein n=1 Tax=Rhodotorula taiwanensis TaxID=741276 RepID=A0A2S5BFR6_9BASI|nr:hypothetical protein BMF94_1236 [Rhodotorula taiwanensis]
MSSPERVLYQPDQRLAPSPGFPQWPSVHGVWADPRDLLLACQLAALRFGFSDLALDESTPTENDLQIRCNPIRFGREGKTCRTVLLTACKLEGAGWQVVKARIKQTGAHVDHLGMAPTLMQAPSPSWSHLAVGLKLPSIRAVLDLEATLRVEARFANRHLLTERVVIPGPTWSKSRLIITCETGASHCSFEVVVDRVPGVAKQWLVIKSELKHTCTGRAQDPSAYLLRSLQFFACTPGRAAPQLRERSKAPSPVPAEVAVVKRERVRRVLPTLATPSSPASESDMSDGDSLHVAQIDKQGAAPAAPAQRARPSDAEGAAIEAVSMASAAVATAHDSLASAKSRLTSLHQQVREAQQQVALAEARLDRRKDRLSARSRKLNKVLDGSKRKKVRAREE